MKIPRIPPLVNPFSFKQKPARGDWGKLYLFYLFSVRTIHETNTRATNGAHFLYPAISCTIGLNYFLYFKFILHLTKFPNPELMGQS